jgi:ATP-dependent helicase HrpA
LFAFYDELIPKDIYKGSSFEKWRKTAERDNARLLYLTKAYLMQHDAAHVTETQYPDRFKWKALELPLSYHFAAGEKDDGVTISMPVSLLPQLPRYRLEWLVPGMLPDKVVALIRALPIRK